MKSIINIKEYDLIILDGHGTIYNDSFEPINESEEFVFKYFEKILLLSNIGSKTSEDIAQVFSAKFRKTPHRIITSLDIVINYLKDNEVRSIHHFGNTDALNTIQRSLPNLIICENEISSSEYAVFTSLPKDNIIKRIENVLNTIILCNSKVILANPDRISPSTPHKFTVGVIMDGIIKNARKIKKKIEVIEIGKPYLKFSDLGVESDLNIIFVGDNLHTDIKQSEIFHCQGLLLTQYNMDIIDESVFTRNTFAGL